MSKEETLPFNKQPSKRSPLITRVDRWHHWLAEWPLTILSSWQEEGRWGKGLSQNEEKQAILKKNENAAEKITH